MRALAFTFNSFWALILHVECGAGGLHLVLAKHSDAAGLFIQEAQTRAIVQQEKSFNQHIGTHPFQARQIIESVSAHSLRLSSAII
jgi:hypothetical protein